MNKMIIVYALIGIVLNLLALFCGLPLVVILWINLCYGSLLRLGYVADGDWKAVFRHILPLASAAVTILCVMFYMALNFPLLTPILMWRMSSPFFG